VRVLPDWNMGFADLHAIYPAGRAASPAARALIDHIAQDLPKSLHL
jgi:DNA-binding transcriptional LysR family regulator